MKITIKESTMICPAQDFPNQHLWLSNLDLINQRLHVPTVYIYKPNDSHNSFDVKVLKEALSKVLVPFYPVAGRLGNDDNGRLQINCNGEGVLFIVAESDSTIDQLGDLMLNVEIPQLIPTADYSNNDISSFPLLVLQVTTFKCGGLSLGVQWYHLVGDGTSALHFINSWCDVARGLPISIPPFIDRTIMLSQVSQTPKFHNIEHGQSTMDYSSTQTDTYKSNSIEILKFTQEQLNTLNAKVENASCKTKYSSYQILTAHIWRCACKARGLSYHQSTKLNIVVDGRSRLHPPPPPGYFGNATFLSSSIALSGELLSEPLKDTAERINMTIKRMDDEYLRSTIGYMEGLNDIKSMIAGPHLCQCPNLSIYSWTRLPFSGADFGMGKPFLVRPASPVEGKGYILPSPSDDGSCWALAICLETDHMQSFQKLFYEF